MTTDIEIETTETVADTDGDLGTPEPELMQFQLFLPGITDPRDLDAIKAAIQADPRLTPIALAISGGGLCTMAPQLRRGEDIFHLLLHVPVRNVPLKSLEIQSCSRIADRTAGVAVRLPSDLVRLQYAYQAVLENHPRYGWGHETGAKSGFIPEYREDLAQQLGRKMVGLRFTKITGLQAQVNTDPRLGKDQVGLAQEDEAWFVEQAANEGHDELVRYYEKHGTIAGARLFLLRYPAVDPHSGRWVTLNILEDRPGQKIYVNAVTWSEMQGGDEDGDLGYLGFTKHAIQFHAIPQGEAFPMLVLGPTPADYLKTMTAVWAETQKLDPLAAALTRLQNMMVKELTGLVTYTMHCIARGAASRAACASAQRAETLTHWLTEVYRLASYLTEGVMDAKKIVEGLDGLYDLASGLLAGIRGEELDAAQFGVFLPKERLPEMEQALQMIDYKLDACRETAYGQVVAAGRKLLTGGREIVDRMLMAGHAPEDLWRLLEQDAIGLIYLPLDMGERPELDGSVVPENLDDLLEQCGTMHELQAALKGGEKRTKRVVSFVREGKPTDVKEVFSTLRVIVEKTNKQGVKTRTAHGPCFVVVAPYKEALGQATVTVRFTPAWRDANKDPMRLTIPVPLPMPLPGADTEHRLLKMDGVSQRIWRPGFAKNFKADGATIEMKCFGWLQKVISEKLEEFTHRFTLKPKQVERELADAIVKALQKLPLDTELERMMRRREWEVLARPGKDQVTVWKERLEILTTCANNGFQILCTSKNEPGTVITKANSHGVPAYIAALNPTAKFGQKHRWSELREYRESLTLMHPTLPNVHHTGAVEWPKWMADKVVNLNVVVADLDGLNRFEGSDGKWICVDSLIACPSIQEKMALKELKIECEDEEARDDVAANFTAAGYTVTAYPGRPEKIGNGLEQARWWVKVLGPIIDHGKIKSLVGPIKGVMNVIPVQLYSRNEEGTRTAIDLIIPWSTIEKKEGWDLVLRLFMEKLGITEVEAAADLKALVAQIQKGLKKQKSDGLTEVQALATGHASERFSQNLGRLLVGEVPFYRPKQTARQTFRFKRGVRGIKVQPHTMLMAGGIDWETPKRVYTEFTNLVETRMKAQETFWELTRGEQAQAEHEVEAAKAEVVFADDDQVAAAMALVQAAQAKLDALKTKKGG